MSQQLTRFPNLDYHPLHSVKLDYYTSRYLSDQSVQPNSSTTAVLLIHGGAFMVSSKDAMIETCKALVRKGFDVITPNYRLSTLAYDYRQFLWNLGFVAAAVVGVTMLGSFLQTVISLFLLLLICLFLWFWRQSDDESVLVQHPSHVQDIAHAYKWIDTELPHIQRIVVMGHSAGGHLATLLCTDLRHLQGVQANTQKLVACVGLSGVYSDVRLQETHLGRMILRSAFGTGSHYDAFPIYHVSSLTKVPFLLVNAEQDFSMKSHTFDLAYTLKAAGVYTEVDYMHHTHHKNLAEDWEGQNRHVLERVLAFLKRVETSPVI